MSAGREDDDSFLRAQHEGKNWIWCLHCQRVYKPGEWRRDLDNGLFMCHYEDCDGDAVMDAWDYENIRKANEYPEEPMEGLVYPQYSRK